MKYIMLLCILKLRAPDTMKIIMAIHHLKHNYTVRLHYIGCGCSVSRSL